MAPPRKAVTTTRRMMNRPDHPLAQANGLLPEHRMLLFDSIGPGPHPCHWCNAPLEWRVGGRTHAGSLIVDHIDGNWRNNDLANLAASCQRCNASRAMSLSPTEVQVVQASGRRTRAIERTCQTCGKDFLTPPARLKRRPNSGRFCSRECLWKRNT